MVAPASRSYYVSRSAIYLWSGSGSASAHLYRLPLDGAPPHALRVEWSPLDQFSFREANGELAVLLVEGGGGDAMWSPEIARGRLRLLRAPLAAFSAHPARAAATSYAPLPAAAGGSLQNRFVGDWLLYGSGSGWLPSGKNGGQLFAASVRHPARVERLGLDHGIDRIEAAGRNAIVVGSGRRDLYFTSIALDGGQPAMRATFFRPDAAQGETRSHGFFFLPDREGGGLIGLPVRRDAPASHLARDSAEVLFLGLAPSLLFRPLGALAARRGDENDRCRVSCTDWYGNARPIFLGDRVLALLGYELVEGRLVPGRQLRESRRAHFLHP